MKNILILILFFCSFPILAQTSSDENSPDLDSIMDEGMTCLNDGDYQKAESLFLNILAGNEEVHDAGIGLGRAVLYQNRLDEAYEIFNQVVARHDSGVAWFFRGFSQFRRGNNDQARADYLQAINRGYNHFDVFFNIGYMHFQSKEYKEGESWFRQALDRNQNYSASWYYLGICRYKQNLDAYYEFSRTLEIDSGYMMAYVYRGVLLDRIGEYSRAVSDYSKAVEINPEYAWGYFYLGKDLERLNRGSEAVESLEKAIFLGLTEAQVYDALADSYWSEKRYNDAATNYDIAVSKAPDSAWIWNNRGYFFRQRKEYEKAIQDFRKAIELDPEWAKPYNNLGYTYNCQNKYEFAVEPLRKAVELAPDWSWPWNNLGNALIGLKQYDEAISSFQKSIECDPEYGYPHYNLGILYNNTGEYEKSVESYRKSLEINPRQADCYNNLGNSLVKLELYDEAIEIYTKGLEINPDHELILANRGEAFYKTNRKQEAVNDLIRAVELGPNRARTHNYLGRSYAILRCYEDARRHLERAIELDSSYESTLSRILEKLKEIDAYLIVHVLWDDVPVKNQNVKFSGLPEGSRQFVTDSQGTVLIHRSLLKAGRRYLLYRSEPGSPEDMWDFSDTSFFYSETQDEVRLQIKKKLKGITPDDEVTISDSTPFLRWEYPDGAEYFVLAIAKRSKNWTENLKSYVHIRRFENLTDSEYQVQEELEPDEYLWFVTAYSADGVPLYYLSRKFTVE